MGGTSGTQTQCVVRNARRKVDVLVLTLSSGLFLLEIYIVWVASHRQFRPQIAYPKSSLYTASPSLG